jgi:cytochrome P450
LLEFLIAGQDTTGNRWGTLLCNRNECLHCQALIYPLTALVAPHIIVFTLIELAKFPHEQMKLRESLSGFSPENWSNCERLKRVVKEGMRLHPMGRSLREVRSDFRTSKNQIVPNCSSLQFRDPGIFDNPDCFQPSRWESPTKEMLDAFIPFSLGKQFSTSRVEYFTSKSQLLFIHN